MKKGIVLTALILIGTVAFAAEHGAHHDEGIPVKMIVSQAINFTLLFVFLYFALRQKVSEHFKHRAAQYNELVQRAEKDRLEAEAARRDIQTRLNNLVTNSEKDLAKVRAEAEELKKKMLTEAEELAKKLEQDAKQAIALEVEKAKANMRNEILLSALQNAEAGLKGKIQASEHRKLQHDFIQKMKVVN